MKKQYITILTATTLALSLASCSHVSPRYNASATNVEEIRQITKDISAKISTGEFTATEIGKKSIVCRAAGPVGPSDNEGSRVEAGFDQFIKDAIADEFKIAGIYDEKSNVKLKGNLDSIDFSSSIGAGKWMMKMTFSSQEVEPFVVENTYSFSTNFIADIACEQVSQALPAATQDFIKKLIQHPSFRNILTQKVAIN
ncbi:MAG: hypothetical protein V9G21_04125 [Methylotenera sp.]